MKKIFLKSTLQYSLILFGILIFVIFLSEIPYAKNVIAKITNTTDYLEATSLEEILPIIQKLQKEPQKKKLIIGDSVCACIFEPYEAMNPDYCVAGTNRGIGMPGQYIMAKLFLDTHADATEIDLILTTNSIITGYENLYGYQYSTQPFLETDTLNNLDADTLDDMKYSYGFFSTNKDFVRVVDNSPILKKTYLNLLNKYHSIYVLPEIPDVVVKYVYKIKDMCDERGVDFYLISAPISNAEGRAEIEEVISKSYKKSKLQEKFSGYYENLFYYPADIFPDGIHPIAKSEVLCEMIHNMADSNQCMQDFCLPH